jgi:hypothetical protein
MHRMNPTSVLDASCVSPGRSLVRRNNTGASPEEFSSFAARHTSIPGTGRWPGASPSDAQSVRLVVAFPDHSTLDPVLDAH